MAILAPATEFVAPLFVVVAELFFWLVLFVLELLAAIFYRRKVKFPARPKFTGAREWLKSFANAIREKRAKK